MFFRKSRLTQISLSTLIVLCLGCSQDTMQEEAIEILSVNEKVTDSSIQKSADGLQFINRNDETAKESTVGFSQEGKISYKGEFKNGKPHGLWITYFPDGKPRWEGYKQEGVNHGSFTMWYENGKKRIEGSYENGLKHGRSIAWHPNGAKRQQKSYHLGNPVGTWKIWDEKGTLISELLQAEITESDPLESISD